MKASRFCQLTLFKIALPDLKTLLPRFISVVPDEVFEGQEPYKGVLVDFEHMLAAHMQSINDALLDIKKDLETGKKQNEISDQRQDDSHSTGKDKGARFEFTPSDN